MKKVLMQIGAFFAALAIFAVIWYRDSVKTNTNEDKYSMPSGQYTDDGWYEIEERADCTVTKYVTMGQPSVVVEFYSEDRPVTVTVTRGSKTTLVYLQDSTEYEMYTAYRNDSYIIEEDFANLEDIVKLAFDWSDSTYMGVYSETEAGTMHTDEDGNVYYYDENGNQIVYQYGDEI